MRLVRGCACVLPVLGAMAVITGCAAAPVASTTPRDLHAEINTFLHGWNVAIAAQDQRALRAMYAADERFHWFEDGALRYTSVDEIIAAMDQFPPGTRIETRLSDIAAAPLTERLASGSAAFHTRLIMPRGEFAFAGVFTMVLERGEDGWVFLHGHTSTARPQPARE